MRVGVAVALGVAVAVLVGAGVAVAVSVAVAVAVFVLVAVGSGVAVDWGWTKTYDARRKGWLAPMSSTRRQAMYWMPGVVKVTVDVKSPLASIVGVSIMRSPTITST